MGKVSKDKGIIFVLLERFNKQRLPRARELKARVDSGVLLDKREHAFIKEVFSEAGKIEQLVGRNPEYRELYEEAVKLWKGIVEKDQENQKKVK